MLVIAIFGSAAILPGCALAPSDPPAPPLALRADKGVLHLTVGSCVGDVLAVAITPVRPDGEPAAVPSFEADIVGGGSSVGLGDSRVVSRGTYAITDRLLVEVDTEGALAVGEWPGTTALTNPASPGVVMVDNQVMRADAFESVACSRP